MPPTLTMEPTDRLLCEVMAHMMHSVCSDQRATRRRAAMPFAMLLACSVFGCSSGELPPQDAAGVAGSQPCHRYNSAQRVNARGKRHISVDGFDERHCVTPRMGD